MVNLVVIQVRVPKATQRELVSMQNNNGDISLSAYCRRVLTNHVKAKKKKRGRK